MPLLSRWSDREIEGLLVEQAGMARKSKLGSRRSWVRWGNAFYAAYSLGRDLDPWAKHYAWASAHYALCHRDQSPGSLLIAWRLAAQRSEKEDWEECLALLVRATTAADQMNPLLVEPLVAMGLHNGGMSAYDAQAMIRRQAAGPWRLSLLGAPAEARAALSAGISKRIETASRATSLSTAVATIGKVGWLRGVAWVRLQLDGETIVPTTLAHYFFGFPRQS